MKDRVPQNPGRVLITPEGGGVPYYATVQWADNPVEAGTPINKAALLSDATEVLLWGSAANRTVDEALQKLSLKGCIVIWSGAANAIPAGWALCNGSNGTPDLRDRFVVGAGSSYGVGATGGEERHTLTVSEMPRHSHTVGYAYGSEGGGSGTIYNMHYSGYYKSTSSEGSGQSHENRPPYYALCYIMKL